MHGGRFDGDGEGTKTAKNPALGWCNTGAIARNSEAMRSAVPLWRVD